MQAVYQQLADTFGFAQFRDGQKAVIEAALDGQSTLAIFPTGSGKSLCYQLTALQLPHLTLVVSPLLALMQDQLQFLLGKGIRAARIDSSLDYAQQRQIMDQARAGELTILMVSVERFKNEGFRHFIQSIEVSMLVIDEAHCISEWGHNFRPDYLKLPTYQQQLAIPQVMLLTATATAAVKQDMADKFQILPENIIQTGFYRPNLHLRVSHVAQSHKPLALLEQLQQLSGSGIVYVTLQQQADELAQYLRANGLRAKSYHAGLQDDTRKQVQQQFMADEVNVVVATIAFGMGVDKHNIRYVIHYELPKSIESYSQEIGRAGRDGQAAQCITLANLENRARLENFVYADTPSALSIVRVLGLIQEQSVEQRWEMQPVTLSNATDVRQLALKTLIVQLELRAVLTPLYSYFSQIRFRYIQPQQQIIDGFAGQRQQFLADIFACSELKTTWATLDQASFAARYPNDRARLISALDYLHDKGYLEVQRQRNTDVFKVSDGELHAAQLAAQLSDYFSNKESAEIQRLDDLIGFFESDQCLSQRLAKYFDDHTLTSACGHCSVCEGASVTLPKVSSPPVPEMAQLTQAHQGLSDKLQSSVSVSCDAALFARFLAGISTPYLTRIKAKNLYGFGLCKNQRFATIKDLVAKLLSGSEAI